MKRKKVLDAVRKYIENEPEPKFVPGETSIRTAGSSWDADDVVALVDVALGRWYAGGRVAYEFEKFMATPDSATLHCVILAHPQTCLPYPA